MLSVTEALAAGTRHHQAGQLAEAERIYLQILSSEPSHAPTLHQLGILMLQSRNPAAAADLFARAIRVERNQAAFHANLGAANWQLQKIPEAIASYQTALKLQPDLAHIHRMLGVVLRLQGRNAEAIASLRTALKLQAEDNEARTELGHALRSENKLAEAELCFRRALRSEPESAAAHFNMGEILHSQGKSDQAVAYYRAALERDPRNLEAHNNLGTILNNQGLGDEAMRHYQAALAIKPDCAAAHTNLGALYLARRQFDEAVACYRAALSADPTITLALHNLGSLLQKHGRHQEALECFDRRIKLEPTSAVAHMGRGSSLQVLGDYEGAIASYQEAMRLDPNDADICSNLGVARGDLGDRDEAVALCRRAVELRPGFAGAHGNLGASLQFLGKLDEAIAESRKALELEPDNARFHSNVLYQLNYTPSSTAASLFAEHRRWGERFADPLSAASAPHANDRTLERRLRVGYVSPHFRGHAVNFFSEPILASHDHSSFEVFCYSDVLLVDETTRRLRGYADQWRDTAELNDEEMSELVRRDQIDILVDLTGHIGGGNRMLVFSRKPAPIQVTYIGYQNTTGMLAMDYRLTDDYSDPPGLTDKYYTEKLVRLPRTFFCYLPSPDAPAITPLPASSNGYVTFASINNFNKITPEVLKTWAGLLNRVAGSRLLVRADMTPSLRQYLWDTFAEYGIGRERLEMAHRLPRLEYLELIGRADVALDPFPFNGHTTTCDCLWQGVPVVTLSGDSYVTRFGGSALATLGLNELIAGTPDQYVDTAAALAADLPRLTALRSGLRERMAGSPLLDFQSFTRGLETEYRRMWATWCEKS